MTKKRQAKPKFQEGDRVIEVNKPTLLIESAASSSHFKRENRGVGTIKNVTVKKNRAGASHFYFSVFWDGTKTESTHSSMRLQLVEEQ